jgi:hypothetical protein
MSLPLSENSTEVSDDDNDNNNDDDDDDNNNNNNNNECRDDFSNPKSV